MWPFRAKQLKIRLGFVFLYKGERYIRTNVRRNGNSILVEYELYADWNRNRRMR